MKAVHFGGGNIGRGFIGLLLSQAGYRVEFVDVDDQLVQLLQQRGQYTVQLANEKADCTIVDQVSAINGNDKEAVAQAVAEADIVTTAVGVNVLKYIAGNIAEGIRRRLERSSPPLTIIACENTIGGSTQLKSLVYEHLPEELIEQADRVIAFPDAAVDRIVPLQQNEDRLKVVVEPFYEWVVDRSAMFEDSHEIPGVHYTQDLQPYIERKLFTVNTGHCCAAYHGYLQGFSTIQEVMQDQTILNEVRGALKETGAALISQYGFDSVEHDRYIDKILERFRNPYLTDEVVRVGRSPIRKLSPNDRLVRPALIAHSFGIETPYLTKAMAAALLFDYEEDPEAVQIQISLMERGVGLSIADYTGLPSEHPLHEGILLAYESLKRRK
ncbi:mannitol-1-phosphate 5-dehydrogenase [Cohnella abietis]|uniref:Mannitol-1-phosphate 5-dehydrogenase n=1 Tax=Cohnella abietis TaxID=2507935 RepID=A0A3T1DDY7_9BACL|nr:mannitol-1-phosphate 5-dehydrogenase [Cohnella abietis]BBI36371.1 mannitol-1-phosphate 5-dehydrogenase [Cohnella abietis]